MPDYYQQPEYLRDLDTTTTTTTTAAPAPVQTTYQTTTQTYTPAPESSKNRLPLIILGVVGGIILLLLILLLLNRGGGATTPPSDQKIVLQWWGVFMDEEVVQPLIDEYQNQNSNVTIEYANKWPQGQYSDAVGIYKSELNRVLRLGDQVQIPDIFMVDSTWVGDYERYAKTSTTFDAETFRNTFHDAVATNFISNNQVYGVPLWIDTLAILYNKDLLAEKSISAPPVTWSSFKTLAQNLTKKTGNTMQQAGFAAGTANNVSYATELLQLLMLQNGVSLTDETGQPSFSTDPDSVTALEFYKSFANTTSGTWTTSFTNDAASFLEGKTAMIAAPSYRYRDILYFNELYEIGMDIGVAQMPQIDEGQSLSWADYWGNMVALNRPNSQAAWEFLRWLTQPEQLRKLNDNIKAHNKYFGILYPRRDMSSELQNDEYLQVYNQMIPSARTWYMVKGLEIEAEFKKLINSGGTSQSQIAQIENAIQILINNKGQL